MHCKLLLRTIFACVAFPSLVHAQAGDAAIVINGLSSFQSPSKNWSVVGDVTINPTRPGNFKKINGSGILFADANKSEASLTTQASFGDADIEFDFLQERGTISSILLQGRYKINLSDSWGDNTTSVNNLGGIAQLNTQDISGFSGVAPLVNIAKAPGLWQHVRLRFRAPKFTNGNKSADALLEELYINGCLVQQSMELQGPSAGAIATNEVNEGPLAFSSSNGVLAIKNLQIKKLPPAPAARIVGGRRFNRATNPIIITPETNNYLLRGFLMFNNKKKTHVISVGNPRGINFSYDMKQGALLQIWNGPFVDVTEMWNERGEPQLAKPIGSVITLSENPALSILTDMNDAWIDSIGFDDFKNEGYTLDKQRNPSFEYETGGYHVWDKIAVGNDTRSLVRELTVTNVPANLYSRIAKASSISSLGKGLYVIGDKSYYIQIDEKLKPSVRNTAGGVELIVPVSENKTITYSLIW